MNAEQAVTKRKNRGMEFPLSQNVTTETMSSNSTHLAPISLQQRLEDTNYRPAGFDYLRLLLALTVLGFHTPWLISGTKFDGRGLSPVMMWLNPLSFAVVPMFFALSGFLVAGSFDRSKTMVRFFGLRVFRIVPALAVEVLLSALILGPLLTTEPLGKYFLSEDFYLYFLNILGDIHYKLPGVFKTNESTYVNGQLWTVPYELICYVVLGGMAAVGIYQRKAWLLLTMGGYYFAQGHQLDRERDAGLHGLSIGDKSRGGVCCWFVHLQIS